MNQEAQTYEFQAQTRQLLDIVIHSLYSHKEIFLRELISNASDALDRLRFEALTDKGLMDGAEILEIRIDADREARTLSVSDNGIGMSRDEVVANLGTIAKSGTRELMESIGTGTSGEGLEALIGQFGVGFYSVFMVSDRVTVVTRKAGEETATRWESTGEGEYTIGDDRRFMRGTTVTLHLKPTDSEDGLEDFTDPGVIRRLVKQHSDFVAYPIVTKETRHRADLDDEGRPIPGTEKEVVEEVTLNSMTPIWTRPADKVKDEEYAQFYQHIAHDWNEPLDHLSLRAEGRIEYRALLFIPSRAPFDLFYRDQSWGLQLYVRRVLIMDRCEQLLPPYLRFVRGVVDSADLPLNVSREMIQEDRHIRQMRQWLTRKILDHLAAKKREDEETYRRFWTEFGTVIKEGVASDPESRDRLLPLLLFPSSQAGDEPTDLSGYVSRMKEGEEAIYYLTGESRDLVESSPHIEALAARGREVLFLADPIDEFMVQALGEYEGHPLKSAATGSLDEAAEDEDSVGEATAVDLGALLEALRAPLQDHVKEVRVSSRLTTSPACLVSGEHDISPQLERILRQTRGDEAVPRQKRILEVNPDHELIRSLARLAAAGGAAGRLESYARSLYDYSLLAEGGELPSPADFRRRLDGMMQASLTAELAAGPIESSGEEE
jgi:molecular chaperone HtpG